MIKTKRMEFTDLLNARWDSNAAMSTAFDLHTIGCEINSIAKVARDNLKTARDLGKPEWDENFSCDLVLKWMEELQARVQKTLTKHSKTQTK